MKKVIFLLVDSLIPSILEECIQEKLVPAFQFLKERGQYWSNCVTVFPTMTASVDSSLLTGVYPNIHRVPGLIWYDPETKEIINYINGWQCLWKQGMYTCAQSVLYHLNEKHLSKQVSTLFEELAERGFTSGSINTIVHRGVKKHPVKPPFIIDVATGFRLREPVSGPDVLTLGRFVQTPFDAAIPKQCGTFYTFYGINDDYAVHAVKKLIRSNELPDFTLVYLPDNDHLLHRKNPDHGVSALIQVDQRIQEILGAFDSWDAALEKTVFIVTGDHGQTRIGDEKQFNIDLDELLKSFHGLPLGKKVEDHDFVLCNNERMAYVYPLKPEKEKEILRKLLSDARIDLLAIKKDRGVLVKESGSGKEIYFAPGGPLVDIYASKWTISGDWSVLDLYLDCGIIHYRDYPDGLARLYGALYSQEIPMIVITARPRYEFISRYYPSHLNGGSHGSLHKYDSIVPLLVTGTKQTFLNPPRLVDMKNFILQLFDYKEKAET